MSLEILAVVGTFISIGLAINAFFIKQLVDSINQVKIQTALLIQRSEYTENRIEKFDTHLVDIFKRLNTIERKN